MDEGGKRVSWVELYLDLVFVLAVGQLAHLIIEHPTQRYVWIALGVFVTLWWTWVGFAVLYNRRGADRPEQRALFLAASVPVGVAAAAIGPEDVGIFAAAMAVTRVIAAVANAVGGRESPLQHRIFHAFAASAALFALSIVVPAPWRYVLWAAGIGLESGAMLTDDRAAARRARRDRDLAALEALKPTDPAEALDPHHFAERFGLFLIILLGEVVVEAGQAAVPGHTGTGDWAAIVAAMILPAALWWLYFDSAAELNLKVLELSGGSPTMAKAVFAVGHMLPAFALLITAAGVGLLLEADTPELAYWLTSVGVGIYLLGTRVFLRGSLRVPGAVRALVLVATFLLGRLGPDVSPHAYLWVLTAWVVACAALTARSGQTTTSWRAA
jgi:low temperature requirement protein LtrA